MLVLLSILAGVYLIVGLIYAIWILLFGYDRWYWFPINWLAGPPVIIMMVYFVITGKKNPLGRY